MRNYFDMLRHYNGNNIPANAVFDFSRSLTCDVTVSQIMEMLSQKASIQHITIYSSFDLE